MPTKPYVNKSWEDAVATERGIGQVHNMMQLPGPDPTPQELNNIYSKGFVGASPSMVVTDQRHMVDESIKSRLSLYEAFPWLKPGTGRGKRHMPYHAALSLDTSWGGDEAQTVGSCVSHGCRNAAMVDYGVDAVYGETSWQGRICTENIYRHRGKNSHGWWCSAAAATVEAEGPGGFLYRKDYGQGVDLSKFSRATEQWATNGSAGVPGWLRVIEQENQSAFCIAIRTIEEYLDALYLGFGINICSGKGFSSTCDKYGYARPSGGWNHAMAHVGADDTDWARKNYGGMTGLVMQSWGRWNNQDGTKCPPDFKFVPIGSFFAPESSIRSMITSDSYAICQVEGWDRTLPASEYVKSSTFVDKIQLRLKEVEKHPCV